MDKAGEDINNITTQTSDCDDWMLVSPPGSSKSSDQDDEENTPKSNQQEQATEDESSIDASDESEESPLSSASQSDADDDGLSEIDLNEPDEQVLLVKRSPRKEVVHKALQAKHQTGAILATSAGRANVSSDSNANPRELPLKQGCDDDISTIEHHNSKPTNTFSSNKTSIDRWIEYLSYSIVLTALALVSVLTSVIICYLFAKVAPNEREQKFKKILSGNNSLIDIHPSSHAYLELQSLDMDIADCIKSENPNIVDESIWMNPDSNLNSMNQKPFRGLVCYGQEIDWQNRFEKLKREYNLDMRRVFRQAKKRLSSELLETYHPSLSFKLILNQLEYIEFMEDKRRERAFNRMKAKNHELLVALNSKQRNQRQNYQQPWANPMINLESENTKLRQENEVLKASLEEKAGTVYIRQSLELERCERENDALKRFHYQVAQEVSRTLKRLNFKTVDAAAILDDREGLNAQLGFTRGYLIRLSDEVGTLMAKNKGLENELNELRLILEDDQKSLISALSSTEMEESSSESGLSLTNDDELSISRTNSCRQEAGRERPQLEFKDQRSNWLMRRARLRERLRKASNIDILDKQIREEEEQVIQHINSNLDKRRKHGPTYPETRTTKSQDYKKTNHKKYHRAELHTERPREI